MGWSPGSICGLELNDWFQSLRGFGVGWSAPVAGSRRTAPDVSIPERVWGGLEREAVAALVIVGGVSIPERVWGGLEPLHRAQGIFKIPVSIPERVWGGLERLRRSNDCAARVGGFNP